MQGLTSVMSNLSDKAKVTAAKTWRGGTSEIDVAMIKATTPQYHVVPKEKHVRTLKMFVHPSQPRPQVTYVITELLKRLHEAQDWLTVLKTLMTFHRLIRETDTSFLEELLKVSDTFSRGKGRVLNMDNFIDKVTTEGKFDYSEWIRAYGRYLDEQIDVYSRINYVVDQDSAGQDSRFRTLNAKDLLFQLPVLQKLLQKLLDCMPRGAAGADIVVESSLMLVIKESFKLYKAMSEGVINLADVFFDMDHPEAVKGLDCYRESLNLNARLQGYYASAEAIPMIRASVQFPKLENPPPDFLQQLENYVKEAPKAPTSHAEPNVHKNKSPPLRRGVMSGMKSNRMSLKVTASKDPGMVLPLGATSRSSPTKPDSPNLLDIGDLTIKDSSTSQDAVPDRRPAASDPFFGFMGSVPGTTTSTEPAFAASFPDPSATSYPDSSVQTFPAPSAPKHRKGNPFADSMDESQFAQFTDNLDTMPPIPPTVGASFDGGFAAFPAPPPPMPSYGSEPTIAPSLAKPSSFGTSSSVPPSASQSYAAPALAAPAVSQSSAFEGFAANFPSPGQSQVSASASFKRIAASDDPFASLTDLRSSQTIPPKASPPLNTMRYMRQSQDGPVKVSQPVPFPVSFANGSAAQPAAQPANGFTADFPPVNNPTSFFQEF